MAQMIVVDSRTGNTRKVAEALAAALGGEVVDVVDAPASETAPDTVLFGFWCDKGDCTPEAAAYLGQLSGKRVFLFGTAGFGGAPEYFERILGNVRTHMPEDVVYLGGAMCQGRIEASVRGRYEAMLEKNPDDARAKAMLANFDAAASHPDEDDFAAVIAAAREALGL